MLASQSIEHIDQLLNELEDIARNERSSGRFFASLVERLQFVLGADLAAVMLPSTAGNWLPIAQTSPISNELLETFVQRNKTVEGQNVTSLRDHLGTSCWFATPLRKGHLEKGCVLVTFSNPPSESAVSSLLDLMAAFSEIAALRQLTDIERFLDERWQSLQTVFIEISTSSSLPDAGTVLVNNLVPLLGAVRVTLARRSSVMGASLTAVSGIPAIDKGNSLSKALSKLAGETFRSMQPILRQQKASSLNADVDPSSVDEIGLFGNLLAVELPVHNNRRSDASNCLIVEWEEHELMLGALPFLPQILPMITTVWNQHRRWLRVPKIVRTLFSGNVSFAHLLRPIVRWGTVLVLGFLGFHFFAKPYPLMIEAVGTLEPTERRSVFATADGFVESLLVEDGQKVTAGQVVAQLHSTSLELQIEELRGQLHTLAEKRSGLKVATNQLTTSTKDSLAAQSRLTAEIAQINAQEVNIKEQLRILDVELTKLQVVSPISGFVVARDLRQQLLMRPIRRGDAMFSVVDIDGPWQLRIDVADRDSGYVSRTLSRNGVDSMPIDFVLDSLPEEQFTAKVNWVSDTIVNRSGQGCFLEIRAAVDREVVSKSHMGAGANAMFDCGEQPLWFVWCRPLIEAAQRRLWIWNNEKN